GFLPSYANRSDGVITTFPNRVGPLPKKKPTQYLKDAQLFFDSIMFTGEALRHLIAETGPGQVVIGTDYPFPWDRVPVDHILSTPGLSDDDKIAIPRRYRRPAPRHQLNASRAPRRASSQPIGQDHRGRRPARLRCGEENQRRRRRRSAIKLVFSIPPYRPTPNIEAR